MVPRVARSHPAAREPPRQEERGPGGCGPSQPPTAQRNSRSNRRGSDRRGSAPPRCALHRRRRRAVDVREEPGVPRVPSGAAARSAAAALGQGVAAREPLGRHIFCLFESSFVAPPPSFPHRLRALITPPSLSLYLSVFAACRWRSRLGSALVRCWRFCATPRRAPTRRSSTTAASAAGGAPSPSPGRPAPSGW